MISSSILTSTTVHTENISVLSGKGLTTISKTMKLSSGELVSGPGGLVFPTRHLDELINILNEVKRINSVATQVELDNKG